jgi:hypothetical protein
MLLQSQTVTGRMDRPAQEEHLDHIEVWFMPIG